MWGHGWPKEPSNCLVKRKRSACRPTLQARRAYHCRSRGCTGNDRAGGKDSTVARPTHGSRLLRLALMGQASRSRKGRAMITLSCEEVRREISNYLDDDISPHMRRLLGGAGWARDLSITFL